MQIVETHSHLNGYEWLAVHQPVLISEIQDVLAAVDAEKYRTKRPVPIPSTGRVTEPDIEPFMLA